MSKDLSFQNAIGFARDLIRIPSLPGQEGDAAVRLVAELEDLGFPEVWTDDVGNVVGVIPGRQRGGGVMLSCHLDIVDVGDTAAWEVPPFEGRVAGGFLHGRGAMDIKGPLALQTYAAARFLELQPDRDIIVAHTVLEERGGWGMEHLLASGAVQPDAVIIGEATHLDLCIGHRGRVELIIEVGGLAGHASAPERARNPLHLFPRVIPAIQAFAQDLATSPLLGPSTLAMTAVETLPRSRNVIPDRARIIADWRVLPDLDGNASAGVLRAALARDVALPEGISLSVALAVDEQRTYTGKSEKRPLFTPGFLMSPAHPVVEAARAAIGREIGKEPAVRPWTFATDGGHSCGIHGIPTIGFAPGEERFAHTNRERLDLASAETAFHTYPALIQALLACPT